MRSRSGTMGLTMVVAASIAFPASSAGATCGQKDATTGQSVRGVLALDETQADTEATFKRDTGHKTLDLVFKVNGCKLAQGLVTPTLDVNPLKGKGELPDGGAAVSIKRVESEPSTFDVLLDVDSGKFKPGSYGATVVLRAPYVDSSRTPVTLSRSDNRWLIPAGLGALAALAALLVVTLLHYFKGPPLAEHKALGLVAVAVIGIGAGALLGFVSYQNQDIWTFKDNWLATATAGFGGATGGVMTGLLGAIWKQS